eukprot:11922-Eustigmatos_ZCMA.PRE.1
MDVQNTCAFFHEPLMPLTEQHLPGLVPVSTDKLMCRGGQRTPRKHLRHRKGEYYMGGHHKSTGT